MSSYTFEEPKPVVDDEGLVVFWAVNIIKNGFLTGECGNGDTPQAAMADAKAKVERGEGVPSGD